jgi:hypothetical protein
MVFLGVIVGALALTAITGQMVSCSRYSMEIRSKLQLECIKQGGTVTYSQNEPLGGVSCVQPGIRKEGVEK